MKITKKRINDFLFLLGIVMVIIMIFTFDVDFRDLWGMILKAGYWMIPILAVWILIYFVNALAWREIIKHNLEPDEHVSLWRIFRLTISGYALNNTTPMGGLGGEPYRILELTKDTSKAHATSSVILYSMMHIYSHFWFWFTSIFLYIGLVLAGDHLPMDWGIGIALIFLALFCIAGFYFFSIGYRRGITVKIIGWIGKIPGLKNWSRNFLERHIDTLKNVDQQIAALQSQNSSAFYRSLILEYVARLMLGFEVMFMLILFGKDEGGGFSGYTLLFLHCILVEAITSWCANIIGFLPLQLGVQELGYAVSTQALGLTGEIGIFVSIIARVRQIVWGAIGITLIKVKHKGKYE